MTDTVLWDQRSDKQHLRLLRDVGGELRLLLDGAEQFASRDEHVYHEGIAVIPMLFAPAARVFIGGGGDGLAAARVLGFDEVEQVTVCDLDPAMTELARTQPDLVALNLSSLLDSRVRVVHADAREYLRSCAERFDLVLLDFPCPLARPLERLFTREMYAIARDRLTPGGVIVTQCPPTATCLSLAVATFGSVFSHALPYRLHFANGGVAAFVLASDQPLHRVRSTPAWTRHVDDEVAQACFAFGKDELEDGGPASSDADPRLPLRWILDHNGIDLPACPYAPAHRVLNLPAHADPRHVPGLVRAVVAEHRVVAYVPRSVSHVAAPVLLDHGYRRKREYVAMAYQLAPRTQAVIEAHWARLDNGSITALDAIHVRTCDDPELLRLFERYLDDNADRYLDLPPTTSAASGRFLHLVARRQDGSPAALMMIRPDGWIVDVLFGLGSARQNMLGLLLLLQFVHTSYRTHTERIVFAAATDNIVRFMAKLGADESYVMEVWVPPTRCARLPDASA